MGTADGRLYAIFNPPWWRFDLWLRWLFTRRAKGTVLTFWIDGREQQLKAWGIPNDLPFCAEYDDSKADRHDGR